MTDWHHEDEAGSPDHDDAVDPADHEDDAVDQADHADEVDHTDHAEAVSAEARDPRIAAAVARLDSLGDQPPAEHIEVYEEVHRVLQESLADANHSNDSTSGHPGGSQP